MIFENIKSFTYQVPWKSSSIHSGGHRGNLRGTGYEFRGNVPLVDFPDARRLDLRQSIRDPYEQIQVRVFNQDNTTPIFALCDLSSSMQFRGQVRKVDLAMEIAASIAYSAYESNDVFSFIAYNKRVIENLTTGLSLNIHLSLDVIAQLADYKYMRVGANGVLEVAEYLSQQKGLVFWISDFHMPIEEVEQAMNTMSSHQVIPIVLWDPYEYTKLPKFGFGNLIDPETGQAQTIFFRKSIKQQFEEVFLSRKDVLDNLFNSFETRAIYIGDTFNPETISLYFEEMMG